MEELDNIKQLLLSDNIVNHELAIQLMIGQRINPTTVVNLITKDDFELIPVPASATRWYNVWLLKGFRGAKLNILPQLVPKSMFNKELKRVRRASRKYILKLINEAKHE